MRAFSYARLLEIEIVYYHIAASGWIITGNRIQYMIHEIQ